MTVGGETVGSIGPGLVVLVGISRDDGPGEAAYVVGKTVNLRIFSDAAGRFDRSALDVGADLLVVSQFTLYGDTRRGRRPSFVEAAPPEEAQALFAHTVALFSETGLKVATGRFQSHMTLSLRNDGPVTIMLDSADKHRPRKS